MITKKKIIKSINLFKRQGLKNTIRAIFWYFFKEYYLFYLLNFKRGKLKESLAQRKEKYPADYCKTCGLCCKHCQHYNLQSGLCKVWNNIDYRCRAFPLIKQQWEFLPYKDKCRFYWK